MSKDPIEREATSAGRRARRKAIATLTLSAIALLLIASAVTGPMGALPGSLAGFAAWLSLPTVLVLTLLLLVAAGGVVARGMATARSHTTQISQESRPETVPDRRDEIGTLTRSLSHMLVTIEQQSREINEFPGRLDQVAREAFRDALTDLPNRALFMDRLAHALARAERAGSNLAVLFLDLDRFRLLNETLGREVGDRLLVEVGRRIASCLRPEDTVARLGGDEFGLLLEATAELAGAAAVAERVSAEIQRPFVVAEREILISASIGIALTRGGSMRPDEVLRNADLAMYQAKAEGRARYELYQPGLSVSTRDRLDLQSDLRTACARRELTIHYQPVVTLDPIRAVEVEALIRWDHRRRGVLLPADFIALSEESGLMVPMGQWVLREACRQATAWPPDDPRAVPVVVGVNLSASQFEHDALADEIGVILRETGLDAERLQLEISEAILMRDDPKMPDRLEALKRLGVRLAIDDFGTGYASLSYLKRLPVDGLKIDRSLVKGVGIDNEDTAIVRAVVTLARSLGITVTAEGVETADQLLHLRALGCDRGQGYYFARPVPTDRLPDLLSSFEAGDHHGSPSCLG